MVAVNTTTRVNAPPATITNRVLRRAFAHRHDHQSEIPFTVSSPLFR
jgi:hypothetical protein